jgi:hypothetical protein
MAEVLASWKGDWSSRSPHPQNIRYPLFTIRSEKSVRGRSPLQKRLLHGRIVFALEAN